jgi:hypothetical protein
MNRLRPCTPRHVDQGGNVEIAPGGGRRTDWIGFVRHTHMQRLAIGLAVDRDAGQTKLAAGANYAQGDFSSISNQHLLERPASGRWVVHRQHSFIFGIH